LKVENPVSRIFIFDVGLALNVYTSIRNFPIRMSTRPPAIPNDNCCGFFSFSGWMQGYRFQAGARSRCNLQEFEYFFFILFAVYPQEDSWY
jgi:hypothetical protein